MPLRITNVPDISTSEPFFDLAALGDRSPDWIGHSGLPRNALERLVRRPRLSRYRAAWHAAGDADRGIVISHLPRMTAAVERMTRWRRRRAPHLAFSFNFTDRPVGSDLARLKRDFAGVEEFCVYSRFEADLYPRLFDLPAERFRHVMWTQDTPIADQTAPAPDAPFVMAIGGEGRDVGAMAAAARARPDVRWLVVARPHPTLDHPPANMTVRFNCPAPLTWGLAQRAAAVVVPLLTDTTCCGHITIASAQLLGLPLITTRSAATTEYLDGMAATTVIAPGDPDALARAAAAAVAESTPADDRRADAALARKRYDRALWGNFVADFVTRHA